MRFVLWLAGLAVVLYAALCGALFASQRSFIYLPRPPVVRDAATSFVLPVDGANVVVTRRPHEGPKALIYFGGNGEDVVTALDAFSKTFPDHAMYLVEYRGYGGSTGKPSEASNKPEYLDILSAALR
jgi:hypothetical protein